MRHPLMLDTSANPAAAPLAPAADGTAAPTTAVTPPTTTPAAAPQIAPASAVPAAPAAAPSPGVNSVTDGQQQPSHQATANPAPSGEAGSGLLILPENATDAEIDAFMARLDGTASATAAQQPQAPAQQPPAAPAPASAPAPQPAATAEPTPAPAPAAPTTPAEPLPKPGEPPSRRYRPQSETDNQLLNYAKEHNVDLLTAATRLGVAPAAPAAPAAAAPTPAPQAAPAPAPAPASPTPSNVEALRTSLLELQSQRNTAQIVDYDLPKVNELDAKILDANIALQAAIAAETAAKLAAETAAAQSQATAFEQAWTQQSAEALSAFRHVDTSEDSPLIQRFAAIQQAQISAGNAFANDPLSAKAFLWQAAAELGIMPQAAAPAAPAPATAPTPAAPPQTQMSNPQPASPPTSSPSLLLGAATPVANPGYTAEPDIDALIAGATLFEQQMRFRAQTAA